MKISGKILLAAVLLAAVADTVSAARNMKAFSNVRTGMARMPFYKNDQLEYYMRSQSMTMRGKLMDTVWPMIDSIRDGVALEMIAKSDNSREIYALYSPLDVVTEFWSKRAYSDGMAISESGVFDQAQRTANGTGKVFLRSPGMDLNGVGFSADFNNNTIKVNSNVEIVLRNSGSSSPIAALGTDGSKKSSQSKEKKVTVTRAYCDELYINSKLNTVTLVGNVRIFDEAGTITCEKLELGFAGSKDKDSKSSSSVSGTGKKLKNARFIGKVHAVRKPDAGETSGGEQYADADLMIYNAADDTLELTGSRPRLTRGSDIAEAERIVMMPDKKIIRFFDKCFFKFRNKGRDSAGKPAQFDLVYADYADWNHPENLIRLIGHARLVSPAEKAELLADRVEITLAGSAKNNNSSIAGGSRPQKAVASGNVRIRRDNGSIKERVNAGRMTYIAENEHIVLEQKPVVQRGGDLIKGGEITHYLKQERTVVRRSSHILLSGATVGKNNLTGAQDKKPDAASPVTVDSQSSDLNMGKNQLIFTGNVRVSGRGMKLDSDKLDIFLKDAGNVSGKKSADAADVQQNKKPVRALATGNVHAEDAAGILESGVLDMYFGEQLTPGKTEVEKIIAEKKVHIESKPDTDKKSNGNTLLGKSGDGTTSLDAERGVMDMIKDQADFYDNVVVSDTAVKLNCEHLNIIAHKTADVIPTMASFKAQDEFPDRLAVGEGRELMQVNAYKKVNISRTLPSGEVQKVRGDQAVYTVKKRRVEMTCQPPKRPQALTADSGMVGDKIIMELDTEDIVVESGDALTKMNDSGF